MARNVLGALVLGAALAYGCGGSKFDNLRSFSGTIKGEQVYFSPEESWNGRGYTSKNTLLVGSYNGDRVVYDAYDDDFKLDEVCDIRIVADSLHYKNEEGRCYDEDQQKVLDAAQPIFESYLSDILDIQEEEDKKRAKEAEEARKRKEKEGLDRFG